MRKAMRKNKYTESNERRTRGSKRAMLLSVVGACLSVTLQSSSALAEGCVSSPDCQAMGYTASSCSDGGVKCPWGDYWFCGGGKKDVCLSCYVGWILNSDMTCSQSKASGKTPIGVVSQHAITTVGAAIKCQGVAVALRDLIGRMTWSNADSQCNSYSASGVTGWRLPTQDELLAVYGNISSVQDGLTKAGGTQFSSDSDYYYYYWSSSFAGTSMATKLYYVVDLVSGDTRSYYQDTSRYVRPVLDLSTLR